MLTTKDIGSGWMQKYTDIFNIMGQQFKQNTFRKNNKDLYDVSDIINNQLFTGSILLDLAEIVKLITSLYLQSLLGWHV